MKVHAHTFVTCQGGDKNVIKGGGGGRGRHCARFHGTMSMVHLSMIHSFPWYNVHGTFVHGTFVSMVP